MAGFCAMLGRATLCSVSSSVTRSLGRTEDGTVAPVKPLRGHGQPATGAGVYPGPGALHQLCSDCVKGGSKTPCLKACPWLGSLPGRICYLNSSSKFIDPHFLHPLEGMGLLGQCQVVPLDQGLGVPSRQDAGL